MAKTEKKQFFNNPLPAMEEEALNFWDKAEIFKKSVEKEAPRGDYVFYDGPPFATGTPHYGHIVASSMKDVVPRYWTMKGYRVERKWGWDCHGLPIENIVEKEMGSKSKKDIENMGVAEFNEKCRSKVLAYVEEWEKTMRRLGRWADMKNAYKTMDLDFMESVWWVFKQLWDKGLIYEGYRSMYICPRCETTLSQQEIAEGYKMVKDLSVTVKFKIKNFKDVFGITDDVYMLAWTTTPWTLIGNVALAVGKKKKGITYKLIFIEPDVMSVTVGSNGNYEVPKGHFAEKTDKFIKEHKGKAYLVASTYDVTKVFDFPVKENFLLKDITEKELVKLEYEPLFNYYFKDEKLENRENGWKIYAADFVTTEEGTGVVHIAPAFGEDDMELGKKEKLPFIQHVNMDGTIKAEAKDFAGMNVKPIGDTQKTDVEIIKYLARHGLLFSKEKYEHSYPHCWRCETPLINYATTSWFVAVTKVKDKALKLAEKINWSPAHIKEGRFGNWLEGARDWSISRQRFWASVMPIWRCACGEIKVFGSVVELEKISGEKITDLHKHIVDKITFKCEKCFGVMKRVPDVLDTWFDSGSMPYAQMHYPFANKEKFEANFPAEFIAEGVDQTRAWFYYLHVIAVAIKDSRAFNNVIVNGIVVAEDGKKMSKRLNNYPDPEEIFNKYGADAMRYYLISSPVMAAENLNFSEDGVKESFRKINMILWNVYNFYAMYEEDVKSQKSKVKSEECTIPDCENVLDKWVLARLNAFLKDVTVSMNEYNLPRASRPIEAFINDFSTWYLRRSRDRFKGDDAGDKQLALGVTRYVLLELAKVMAPFTPFIAETIWQKVTGHDFKDENKSVHLTDWPLYDDPMEAADVNILKQMEEVRKIVELGLKARDEAGIKVRQMLSQLKITNYELRKEYEELIKDELNVKNVVSEKGKGEVKVELDTTMTEDLKLEGLKREIVRLVNNLRKNAGLTIKDKIVLSWRSDSELIKNVFVKMAEELKKDTLSEEIMEREVEGEEVKMNGEMVKLGIKKI